MPVAAASSFPPVSWCRPAAAPHLPARVPIQALALALGMAGSAVMAQTPVATRTDGPSQPGMQAPSRMSPQIHQPAPPDSPATLSTVRVHDRAARINTLPPVQEGGQVARGSRLGMMGNRDLMDTPFSTISYTSAYAANAQAHSVADVITRTDPAVFGNGATGMLLDSFSIRGFDVGNGDVTWGGLPGMMPQYRGLAELAERIEVQKGPSASLGGMLPGGSVGGSINLVPKRAGDVPHARLTAMAQRDSQLGVHADAGRRFGENNAWGLRVNGAWRDGDTALKNQARGNHLAALGLDYRGARLRMALDAYTAKDRVEGVNRGISLAEGVALPRVPNPRTLLAPGWTYGDEKTHALAVRGEWDVLPSATLWFTAGQSVTDFDSVASSVYQVTDAQGTFANNFAHQRDRRRRRAANVGASLQLASGPVNHHLAVSAGWFDERRRFAFALNLLQTPWITSLYSSVWGTAPASPLQGRATPDAGDARQTGIAVADTLSFADDAVQLTLGVRRQQVRSNTASWFNPAEPWTHYDASATTPTLALLVRAADGLSVYAHYVEGLTPGGTAPAGSANAGQSFAPYKARQHEVGVKLAHGGSFTTLSLFQLVKASDYTDPVTRIFSADGRQRNRGLELNVSGALRADLRLLGGVSWMQPRLTRTAAGVNQGKVAPATPRLQARLGAEWDVQPGLTLLASMQALSRQYLNEANTLQVGGRAIYDAGIRYQLPVAGRPVTLRAMVTNLANRAYWAGNLWTGMGAPRTVLLSASVDF